jgi:hypothetical protein
LACADSVSFCQYLTTKDVTTLRRRWLHQEPVRLKLIILQLFCKLPGYVDTLKVLRRVEACTDLQYVERPYHAAGKDEVSVFTCAALFH